MFRIFFLHIHFRLLITNFESAFFIILPFSPSLFLPFLFFHVPSLYWRHSSHLHPPFRIIFLLLFMYERIFLRWYNFFVYVLFALYPPKLCTHLTNYFYTQLLTSRIMNYLIVLYLFSLIHVHHWFVDLVLYFPSLLLSLYFFSVILFAPFSQFSLSASTQFCGYTPLIFTC